MNHQPIITLDLGGTRTKYGVVKNGVVLDSDWCDADSKGSLAEHLEELQPKLLNILAKLDLKPFDCGGIGISSTGLVDSEKMRVLSTNGKYVDAIDLDFIAWGQRAFDLPVRILNDAKAALLSEYHYGAAKGIENVLFVGFGTGIGTAALVDGNLLKGHNHCGGNLGGHIVVNPNGRPCTCGGRGCLESEASGWVIPTLIQEHPNHKMSPLNDLEKVGFKEIIETANSGDSCAVDIQEHLFSSWGRGIVSMIHMLGSELVIIGGGIMNNPEPVLKKLAETITAHAWADFKNTPLICITHPDDAALLGVASLFLTENNTINN